MRAVVGLLQIAILDRQKTNTVKRLTRVLACLLGWSTVSISCSEKEEVPPIAPEEQRRFFKEEIDDGGGGGGGSTHPDWDYTWVHIGTIDSNYGANGGQSTGASREIWDVADSRFVWRTDDECSVFVPTLINQDGKAEQRVLAKAIVWAVDGSGPDVLMNLYPPSGSNRDSVTYYDEAWHAIRNMMIDYYDLGWAGVCGGDTLCDNGWIGVARNLMAYVVAADYLLSRGGPDGFGYRSRTGQEYENDPLSNLATADSFRTFVEQFLEKSDDVKAPQSPPCMRDAHLKDMASEIPDNKGIAALASFATLAIFSTNMDANDVYLHATLQGTWSSYDAETDSVKKWLKGWAGDRNQHVFAEDRFTKGKSGEPETWENTYVQGDSVTVVPIRGPDSCVQWPFHVPASGDECEHEACCHWGEGAIDTSLVYGAPVEDMMRSGHTPKTTCESGVCAEPDDAPPFLLSEQHVRGTIGYLADALEVLYQDGYDLFEYNSARIPQAAIFHEWWAEVYDDASQQGWDFLREDNDDWASTYIWDAHGFDIIEGVPSQRGLPKQIGFTDLTHP